jgi:extracellular elastinolytic metalloproteinase
MKKHKLLFTFLVWAMSYGVSRAQHADAVQIAKNYVTENAAQWQATAEDMRDLVLSSSYVSEHNKLTHVYFLQRYAGIEIHNGVINVNVMEDGKVLLPGFNGINNLASKVNTTKPTLTPQQALTAFARYFNVEAPARWKQIKDKGEQKFVFDKDDLMRDNIEVALCYQRIGENQAARLAWHIVAEPISGQDVWSARIDALTGEMLEKNSLTMHCSFHDHKAMRGYEFYHNCVEDVAVQLSEQQEITPFLAPKVASYNVFKFPVESPIHGGRSITYDTSVYKIASPFGWHDVDGVEGAEYTITRGNNVHAYEDLGTKNKSNGNEPNGGTDLNFDYTYSSTAEPVTNQNAAIVNLFYINNFMHDFTFKYGFNEAAGNFQQKNYKGSTFVNGYEGDAVQAEARDGSGTNNANFATQADGTKPRMQMYEWTSGGKALTINSPASIAGTYDAGTATWGKQLDSIPFIGDLVLAYDASSNPSYGCNKIKNKDEIKGKIAVVDRGGCFFSNKALNVQEAGAIGILVVDFEKGTNGMGAGDAATAAKIKIPGLRISVDNGNIIKEAMKKEKVNASFVLPAGQKPDHIDGDFDNGIVAHEYGHGISNRLTGGRRSADCLNNQEQMGEGWSDFFALIATVKPGDKGTDQRGVGNFANRTAPDGIGIRTYPYTTDMKVNLNTYASTTAAETHRLGEVWTSMAWDLYWAMADAEGFDPDLINGKGGNNKAIQLVMDGMKIQKCQPGFVDGRDAIIAADEANYKGVHKCLIWDVFARRGLGKNADQGSSLNAADVVEGFKSIPECQKTLKIEKVSKDVVKVGDEITITLNVRNDLGKEATNVVVTDILPQGLAYINGSASDGGILGAGDIVTFNFGKLAQDGKKTLTYKVKVMGKSSTSSYFEGFNGRKTYDDNWGTDQIETTGAYFDATQDVPAYEGTWSIGAVLDAAFKTNATTNLNADKAVLVSGKQPILRYYQNYKIQHGVDGVILDISKDGGNTWRDAGNLMFRNGYNGPIAYSTYSIPDAKGFWGNSKGWIPTYIDLKDYVGEKIQFRYRFVGDQTISDPQAPFEKGINIDNIEIMDLVNYNTEACITADGGAKGCATMEYRGIKVESDRSSDAKDLSSDLHATLFPNPANEAVNINLRSDKAGAASVAFYDASGRQVLSQNIYIDSDMQMFSFPTAALPTGLYTVKISQANGFAVRKFVKM